jgi:protein TonB
MAATALLALLLAAQPARPARPPARSPAAPAPSAAPPAPTAWPFRRFSDDDYPAAALRGQQQGRVVYRVEIGPDGRVSGCEIRRSSGSAALDAATCRIVRSRARFTPARDSAGRPVADHREGDVLWRLRREEEE